MQDVTINWWVSDKETELLLFDIPTVLFWAGRSLHQDRIQSMHYCHFTMHIMTGSQYLLVWVIKQRRK